MRSLDTETKYLFRIGAKSSEMNSNRLQRCNEGTSAMIINLRHAVYASIHNTLEAYGSAVGAFFASTDKETNDYASLTLADHNDICRVFGSHSASRATLSRLIGLRRLRIRDTLRHARDVLGSSAGQSACGVDLARRKGSTWTSPSSSTPFMSVVLAST